ncbi:MAG: hypothetical protein ACTSQI_19420 [Candidatus Helarchaeota archaeon]
MLQVSQLQAHLKFITPANLPYWMGSAFRGAFGQRLRQVCCTDFRKDCQDCETQADCLFYYMYMREKATRGHAKPIKPIILIPPFFGREMFFREAGFLNLELLLFGDFMKYIPHVILGLNLLGQRGIGSVRYTNLNRFIIDTIISKTTGAVIYDGGSLSLTNYRQHDITKFPDIEGDTFIVKFRTPYSGPDFPPEPDQFLTRIRNRLIRFVNEYGSQARVPEVVGTGKIVKATKHFHHLERRSSRSQKRVFKGHTGIVTYHYTYLNQAARWLLQVGAFTGCGPDAAFGFGFFDINPAHSTHTAP